jgi:hypothetical protein
LALPPHFDFSFRSKFCARKFQNVSERFGTFRND